MARAPQRQFSHQPQELGWQLKSICLVLDDGRRCPLRRPVRSAHDSLIVVWTTAQCLRCLLCRAPYICVDNAMLAHVRNIICIGVDLGTDTCFVMLC